MHAFITACTVGTVYKRTVYTQSSNFHKQKYELSQFMSLNSIYGCLLYIKINCYNGVLTRKIPLANFSICNGFDQHGKKQLSNELPFLYFNLLWNYAIILLALVLKQYLFI